MPYIENAKILITNEMEEFNKIFSTSFCSDDDLLNKALSHLLQQKGKQIRPTLTILAAKLCGNVTENTHYLAAAFELLHSASLAHDDVIDNSEQRRNMPTLNTKFGNKTAVLVGDYLVTKAMDFVNRTQSLTLFDHLQKLSMNIVRGELLQHQFSHNFIQEVDYYNVIKLKTASLFAVCALSGAISGGGNEQQTQALYNFGEILGICFQIKDDIIDYSQNDVGKPVFNDISEGKITLPLLHALNFATEDEKSKVFEIINNNNISADDKNFVINLIDKHKGLNYAKKQMLIFKEKAVDCLSIFENSQIKNLLIEMLDFAIEREN